MWTRQRAILAAAALLLAASQAACTGEEPREPTAAPTSSPSPSSTPTGAPSSLRERAAPYDVGYRVVAGKVPPDRRARVLRGLARPVRRWVDAGFVRGPWPRAEGFRHAFAPFHRRIGRQVRRDAGLLTLQAEGRSLAEVVPQRRRIAISVTGVRGRVVGATARVDLRVLGVESSGRRMRVNVRGELFLTRVESHGWQIFGYRLDRWVDQGAMTRGGA